VRYVITQDEATWLRSYYAVEIYADAGDVEDDARDKLFNGECDWLGFDMEESVENVDTTNFSVERTVDTPFIVYPASPPAPARVAEQVTAMVASLVAALRTLADLCDERGIYPQSVAVAREALKPFTTKEDA
jgi:hypothetical protein